MNGTKQTSFIINQNEYYIIYFKRPDRILPKSIMIYCEVSDFSFINLPSPVKSTPIEIGNMIKPPKPGSGINVQNYLPAPIITSYDSSYIQIAIL